MFTLSSWRKANLQYTRRNPKSWQMEDNHLTKQACYVLPTLEWESGLQSWRARALSPDSGAGKTICLCTLFIEFHPFSVSCLSKIQSTIWIYWSTKSFFLQLEGFHLMDVTFVSIDVIWGSGYIHSTVFLQHTG